MTGPAQASRWRCLPYIRHQRFSGLQQDGLLSTSRPGQGMLSIRNRPDLHILETRTRSHRGLGGRRQRLRINILPGVGRQAVAYRSSENAVVLEGPARWLWFWL